MITTTDSLEAEHAAFLAWANSEGLDTAHTYDTMRSKWVMLNPMTGDLWTAWQARAALVQPAEPVKDHVLREVVNSLRDTAVRFFNTGQLRERLRECLDPLLPQAVPQADHFADADNMVKQADSNSPESHGISGADQQAARAAAKAEQNQQATDGSGSFGQRQQAGADQQGSDERDAARYRFMRSEATGNFVRFCPYGRPDEIDRAIDAAIAATQQEGV